MTYAIIYVCDDRSEVPQPFAPLCEQRTHDKLSLPMVPEAEGQEIIPLVEEIEHPSRQMELTLAFKSALVKGQRVQHAVAEGVSAGTTSMKVSLGSKTCARN